jgi:hypothetical protein
MYYMNNLILQLIHLFYHLKGCMYFQKCKLELNIAPVMVGKPAQKTILKKLGSCNKQKKI